MPLGRGRRLLESAENAAVYFDDFELRIAEGRLLRNGSAVEIEPRVFDLLVHLSRSEGRLVSKEEMISVVWEGAIVTDSAITRAVARLRNALGDSSRHPRCIETAHSRGYRFIASTRRSTSARAIQPWRTRGTAGRTALLLAIPLALLLGILASNVRIKVEKIAVEPSQDRVRLLELRLETTRGSG